MKITRCIPDGLAAATLGLLIAGCASDPNNRVAITNRSQPGPAVGQALGTGVGEVGGNVAGVAVGFGEGVVRGATAPFNNMKTTRVVRRWSTETTSDGRTIQVPEDILVDADGRPLGQIQAP